MPRRNSPHAIEALDDLSDLGDLVFDKRHDQRASAKKNRRNRHYEKQFIRNTLARPLMAAALKADRIPDGDANDGAPERTA